VEALVGSDISYAGNEEFGPRYMNWLRGGGGIQRQLGGGAGSALPPRRQRAEAPGKGQAAPDLGGGAGLEY
jgi:hypothetical protein